MLKFPKNILSGFPKLSFREEETAIAESKLNGGMVTSIDAANLQNNQFTLLRNVRVRFDKTSRRNGKDLLTPTKPDSNKVLLISPWERFDDTIEVLRFTSSSIHRRAAAWNAIAGVLTGGDDDRFNIAISNDRFFFANNGADPIQEIDLGAATFAQAGNAPRYRYLIAFNNRLVGANLYDAISPSAIEVGWSGNLNPTEWNSITDPSAGSTPLIDSTSDFSDDITGLFGFTNTALILRQRSLWGMTKQPVASNPFNFFPIHPSIGCDSPNSAVSVRGGICWFDLRTRTVYHYKVGMQEPVPIGMPVEESIADQVTDTNLIFATYDTRHDEYTLAIPGEIANSLTRMWTFNFKTNAWSYDDELNVSAIASVDYASSALLINDLIGYIDDLVGYINDLGNSVTRATRFYGRTDGDIEVEDELSDTDNGIAYTTEIISKLWIAQNDTKLHVLSTSIDYIPRFEGAFTVSWSSDGGLTWNPYKTVSFTNSEINARKKIVCKRHIACASFMWKIEANTGVFDITKFTIKGTPSQAEVKET